MTKNRHRFRDELLARDGRCLICRTWLDESTTNPHHIHTRGAGGDDTLDNGVSLCSTCHVATHNGHYSPATLRWLLTFEYGYEYETYELGDDTDRLVAERLADRFEPATRF